MERESGKSSVPLAHGVANPFLARAQFLLQQQDHLKKLVARCKLAGSQNLTGKMGPGRFNFAGTLSSLDSTDVKEQLRAFYEQFELQKSAPAVMAPNPDTRQIYGRFVDGTSILDLGSGNCGKLVKYTGHIKISACDQLVTASPEVRSKLRFAYECTVEDVLKKDLSVEFLTSFMAIPQFNPKVVAEILDRDGLHLVPDHDKLIELGCAVREGDKVIVTTVSGPYTDNYIQEEGYAVEPGYKIVAGFTRRSITVDITNETESDGYKPFIQASPICFTDINFDDVSLKNDGVPYELELCDGNAMLTDRAGRLRVGKTNYKGHLAIHVEEMDTCYVLFKVESCNGMLPPHYLGGLKRFLSRVDITISGKHVVAPVEYDPRIPGIERTWKNDGLITRIREKDYYCKLKFTADLYDTDMALLTEKLKEIGKALTVDDVKTGLWEYEMNLRGAELVLTPIRLREDKLEATTVKSVLFMMELRDLGAMESFSDSPWKATIQ